MRFRNKGRLAAAVIGTMICIACGQIYRPVVIPINNIPPSPGAFHAVFSLNTNSYFGLDDTTGTPTPTLVFGPGSGMQIDVGGDTDLGVASLVDGTLSGANPTHGVSLPNFSRVFVASAGSAISTGVDAISSFVPVSGSTTSSGIGAITVTSYPNYVPNSVPNAPPYFCPYLPDFVAASQNLTVYVANYGVENPPNCNLTSTDSITVVNATNNVITNTVYSSPSQPQPISHPVAMAQVPTPNGNKLYVANQGNNTVSSFNTVDMTPNNVTGFPPTMTSPVWITPRGDNQFVYVLSQGDGNLWTLDPSTDAVLNNVSVGAGANYVLYDPSLNRLYVTNPATSSVYIFSVAGNTPSLLSTIVLAAGSTANYPSCVNPCPMSVAALPDTTRAYIVSYQLVGGGCTDPTPGPLTATPSCFVTASITVVDALSTTVTKTISAFPSGTTQVPEVANCIPAAANGLYTPGLVLVPNETPGPVYRFATRFRVSAVASADSTRVYASVCDAGSVAIINTLNNNANNPASNEPPDTLVLDLQTPFGVGTTSNALPQQNPILMLPGR